MFRASAKTSYKWPVTVFIPADGGKFDKGTFDVEFKVVDQERLDDYLLGRGAENEIDLLNEVVIGWKGYADANGEDIPHSESARAALLKIPYVRTALVKALFESSTGGGARRKN